MKAKIRNPYNQIPHLTKDTILKSFLYCVLGQVCNLSVSDLYQQATTRMPHVNIRLTTGMYKNLFFMDVALLSISPARYGHLVKMLIILELHGIFGSNCIRVYLNTVQPLLCTTVVRLLGKFKT